MVKFLEERAQGKKGGDISYCRRSLPRSPVCCRLLRAKKEKKRVVQPLGPPPVVCLVLVQRTSIGEWNSRIWSDGNGASHEREEGRRKLDQTWSVRRAGEYKDSGGWVRSLHTYLEGVIPFTYWGYGL